MIHNGNQYFTFRDHEQHLSSLLHRYNLLIKNDLPAAQYLSCYSVIPIDTTHINTVHLKEKKNPAWPFTCQSPCNKSIINIAITVETNPLHP